MPCEPDSGVLKTLSLPFRPFHVANCGYCLSRYRGMYQPITPVTPFGPTSFIPPLVSVLLVRRGQRVVPVLEDDVDLAVGHRLEARLALGDVRHLHLAAELVLEHVLDDVDVGRRSGPRVLVQRHGAASRRARASTERVGREHGDRRDGDNREHSAAPTPGPEELLHPILPVEICLSLLERHSAVLVCHIAFDGRAFLAPCVTRSSAIPSARIAIEAIVPCPNCPRTRPCATS